MAEDEDAESASKGLAVLAAACPVLVSFASCCLFAGLDEHGLRDGFMNSPVFIAVVVGAAALAILINATLLYFAARGAPVPSFIGLLFSGTPLLVGAVAYAWGMHQATQAVAYADASQRAYLMAAGMSEALVAQLFSGGISAGLLLSFGFGLAIAAQAQRVKEQSPLLALVAMAAALPVLAALAYAMVAIGPLGFGLLLVGLLVVVGAGIAASAIGADRRSGSLAVSAVVALGLSAVAAAVTVHQQQVMQVFRVVGGVDPGSRVDVLVAGLSQSAPVDLAATFLFVPVLALGLLVAVLALMKRKPGVGGVVSGVLLALVAALILVAVPLSKSSARPDMPEPVDDLSRLEGFQPVLFTDGEFNRDSAQLGVSPLRLHREFDLVRASSWEEVESAFREEIAIVADERRRTMNGGPVPIAIDARLSGAQIDSILRIAGQAGIENVLLIGRGPAENPESIEAISKELPLLGRLLADPTTNAVQVSLLDRSAEIQAHIEAAGIRVRSPNGPPEMVTADRRDLGELRRSWDDQMVDVSYEHDLTASDILNGFSLLGDRLEMQVYYRIAPADRPL